MPFRIVNLPCHASFLTFQHATVVHLPCRRRLCSSLLPRNVKPFLPSVVTYSSLRCLREPSIREPPLYRNLLKWYKQRHSSIGRLQPLSYSISYTPFHSISSCLRVDDAHRMVIIFGWGFMWWNLAYRLYLGNQGNPSLVANNRHSLHNLLGPSGRDLTAT